MTRAKWSAERERVFKIAAGVWKDGYVERELLRYSCGNQGDHWQKMVAATLLMLLESAAAAKAKRGKR